MITCPLQVVVCNLVNGPPDLNGEAFVDAAYRAFVGRTPGLTSTNIPNWMMGDELQPLECFKFSAIPSTPAPQQLLGRALHTLVVAWVSEHSVKDANFVLWLAEVWDIVDKSNDQHGFLIGLIDNRLRDELHRQADALGVPGLKDVQILSWESSFAEAAGRPAVTALRCLERARNLLCQGLKKGAQPLKLFISHAKTDGLSLACAMLHAIKQEPTLSPFYDAQDIVAGSNWKRALRQAVHSSVLIAIRTDAYDDRPWCVQEILWAEESGSPIIVVDARSDLFYPPSSTALEASPWVLVPDGSLTRILYCTLRENLKWLLLQRAVVSLGPAVADSAVVLPRAPTWNSLGGALENLRTRTGATKTIVYPDPALPAGTQAYLQQFAKAVDPTVDVLNYTAFAAKH
jgi:hypothetical protein